MFDRAWLERELAGLIVQLHQTEGAISVLQQMLAQLDGAAATAPPERALAALEAALPEGYRIEGGIEPHEDRVYTRLSGEADR